MNLNDHITELGLGSQWENLLERMGVFTIRELLMKTPQELKNYPNIGDTKMLQLYDALAKAGFHKKS